MNKKIVIFIGILAGFIWFTFCERINLGEINQFFNKHQCWEKLHYFNKQIPLYLVHLKSFIAGIVLIILGFINNEYKNYIIIFIGSGIIGLHLLQIINEFNYIKHKDYTLFKKAWMLGWGVQIDEL